MILSCSPTAGFPRSTTAPDRTTVLLNADPEMCAQAAAEERARLDQARAAMTDADVQRLIEEMRRFKEKQVEPDSPEALATLDNFDKSADFLRELDLNEDELTKAIIGAIGGLDDYQLPVEKGFTSLTRAVAGDTEEARQKLRDEVLATTVADVKAIADVLDRVKQHGQVVAMGSDQAINAANAERQLGMQVIRVSGAS